MVVATVEDTCPSCDENHLGKSDVWKGRDTVLMKGQDLSHGAFEALTGGNLDPPGEIDISW